MNGITKEGVHYWGAQNGFHPNMINLDVPNHGFKSFVLFDDAINFLYLAGFKDSAREINKANLNP